MPTIPPAAGKFKCRWCGTVGDKRAYNQCYCGYECSKAFHKHVIKKKYPSSKRARRIAKRERGLFYDCLRCGTTFIRKSIRHVFCRESCRKPGYEPLKRADQTDDPAQMTHEALLVLNHAYVLSFVTRREAGDMSVTVEQYEEALAWLSNRANWPTSHTLAQTMDS